jgi:ribosome-associated toxin RatA of RatAB toxin-antitoxin module
VLVLFELAPLFLGANGAAHAAEAGAEPDLEWIDRAELEAGEVLVEAERSERARTVRVRVATLVAAPAVAIWDVLTACEIAPEYVPNVQSCRSLETHDHGRAELFVQTVKPAFFLPSFEHVFRLDYAPYERIDVRRVSGPVEHMQGSWWLLEEDAERVLLVYELELDPGMPVPRFIVRATLRRDLPRIVTAVRERAEAAARD